MSTKVRLGLLKIGSFILGFGFIGALDGIIFHQLLQWHSVIQATDRAGQIQSDGLFHLAVTITLVLGGILLSIAGNPLHLANGLKLLIGSIFLGGGTFNLLEGIINHHILQIHQVKPGDPYGSIYDLAFLIFGLLLVVIGLILRRNAKSDSSSVKYY